MDRYINCITHKSSDGNLLIGNESSALIDCGMAFCAEDTIAIVKNALAGRELDYIILTHTHYDHVGALPFFKRVWPHLKVVTSAVGAEVLLKATPRRVIRELSLAAAKMYGSVLDANYEDDLFCSDIIVKEGDVIPLGDITVKVFETPGHTRDSLSFLVPEMELLILCETFGVLMPDLSVFPCFLSSFADTYDSTKKRKNTEHKSLSLPHRGIVNSDESKDFFYKAKEAIEKCRDFILSMNDKNLTEEEMLETFFIQYSSKTLLTYQPKEAFILNAKAMISCILRENTKLS